MIPAAWSPESVVLGAWWLTWRTQLCLLPRSCLSGKYLIPVTGHAADCVFVLPGRELCGNVTLKVTPCVKHQTKGCTCLPLRSKYSEFSLLGVFLLGLIIAFITIQSKVLCLLPSLAPISAGKKNRTTKWCHAILLYCLLMTNLFPSCFKAPKSPGTTRKDNIGKNPCL